MTTEPSPEPDANRASLLHHNVLESMSEGVITVDSDARIVLFNPAAARLLGLPRAEVQGKLFAEVFLQRKGLEDFNDTVLAAVYDDAVGSRSTVEVDLGAGATQSLEMMTSYLTGTKDGETRKIGIVVVFDDITEIEALRKAEQQLVESTSEQNVKLRDAYRDIEEKNKALDSALKKVQAVRTAVMLLVVVFFLGAAWYVRDGTGPALQEGTAEISGDWSGMQGEDTITATVGPRRLVVTLSFVGRLAPREEVRLTSPSDGKVARLFFEYGSQVLAGQSLVELDTAEIDREYRDRQAEYLEARERVRELEDWENNPEVGRVRRAVASARLELEARRNKLSETALLLERGIIPASEHEAAKRQYHAWQINYEAAEKDLALVLAKADADAMQIARLRLENAISRTQELERILTDAVVRAPVSGIVLQPEHGGGQDEQERNGVELLAVGRSVSEGDYLLSVGDIDGLSVAGLVDEVDIVKLRPGQPVSVTGAAFPDLEMKGKIMRVSSQSQRSSDDRVPMFRVTVELDRLTDTQRQRLRLGMSVEVEVVVRDEPGALLVPLGAIQGEPGRYWLHVRSKEDGAARQVPVEIGATTLNEAEIVRGIEAGDEVIVSGI
ncbi:MAG: PAS domain-containing protein [Gammaproteobacteria bacterium]|nr:PAS domain-containing protein [Gammaproteobacteria bacterium]